MTRKAIPLVILVVSLALLAAAMPAFGAPPHATLVSGLECIYVDTPGETEVTGQSVHIRGQDRRTGTPERSASPGLAATRTAIISAPRGNPQGLPLTSILPWTMQRRWLSGPEA